MGITEALILVLIVAVSILFALFWILMSRVAQLESVLDYLKHQPIAFGDEETPAFLKRQAD